MLCFLPPLTHISTDCKCSWLPCPEASDFPNRTKTSLRWVSHWATHFYFLSTFFFLYHSFNMNEDPHSISYSFHLPITAYVHFRILTYSRSISSRTMPYNHYTLFRIVTHNCHSFLFRMMTYNHHTSSRTMTYNHHTSFRTMTYNLMLAL